MRQLRRYRAESSRDLNGVRPERRSRLAGFDAPSRKLEFLLLSPISFSVQTLLRRAEDIVEVASQSGRESAQSVIVLDRQGGMRMLDAAGWTLDGLIGEFGASQVFRVETRGGAVRVEGWSSSERCLVQRKSPFERFSNMARPPMLALT